MKGQFYEIIGTIFVIFSGVLHTLERCANFVASGLSAQGLAVFSGNGSLSSPWVGPKDNVFVPFFRNWNCCFTTFMHNNADQIVQT